MEREGALGGLGQLAEIKGNLSIFYSIRIAIEHRLVYAAEEQKIGVTACRYHY